MKATATPTDLPIPPQKLRERVHGASDINSFLEVGQKCSQSITSALAQINKPIEHFQSVLDFGCGSGRVLRWILPLLSTQQIYATDIDREAIIWCARNIPKVHFTVNPGQPPTAYTSQSFDLVYAISVFSHLNEAHQFHLLAELQRITRPGAIVLLSIHGSFCAQDLTPQKVLELEQNGFLFSISSTWKGVFPVWYQTAYQTRDYINKYYSQFFDVIAYIDQGMNNVQDLVVLQRRSEDDSIIRNTLAQVILRNTQDEISLIETSLYQQSRIYELESRIHQLEQQLEQQISLKNQHIDKLENLLKQVSQGRVMRLMNSIGRIRD